MKLIMLVFLVVKPCSSSNETLHHHHGKREAAGDWEDLLTGEPSPPKLHPTFCGDRPGFVQSKIVGGEAAKEGEIPWQAALVKMPGQVVCGAAIISDRIVLTAAHCLKLQPSRYQIWAGRLQASAAVEECHQQKLEISTVRKHPSFSRYNLKNDLAVVMVETKYGQGFLFSPWVLPACLSLSNPGGTGLVSGWGLLSEKSTRLSPTLQAVRVPIKPQSECVAAYRSLTPLSTSQLCAGTEGGGRDSCTGDSGGPMVLQYAGRFYLTAIVSFGRGCGRVQYPGVYTRLQSYIPWIMDTINSLGLRGNTKEDNKEPTEHQVTSVCQGQTKYIWCKWGAVIKITEVFYGRLREDDQCQISIPHYYRLVILASTLPSFLMSPFRYECSLSSAKKELAWSCNGGRTCQVSPDPRPRGPFTNSPCPSYLQPWLSLTFLCLDIQGRSSTGGVRTSDLDTG